MSDRADTTLFRIAANDLVRGGNVIDASTLERDLTLEADVVIVGTGAGGGIAAEMLCDAGLRVILVEEGPLRTARDFHMSEAEAYPDLYQESAARKTKDKAINILQGRCVGGSTTVNWTSSFRTPPATLAYWAHALHLEGFSADDLAPWFARMETRLSIAPWDDGAEREQRRAGPRRGRSSAYRPATIRRNVKGCANLGYCGMGCPLNAKQSMLVTTIPAALDRGATLVTRARAQAFAHDGDRVTALTCTAMDAQRRASHRPADHAPRADVHRRRRRDRHAGRCCCAATFRIRTPSSASGRSCIRSWCPRR